MWSGESTRGVVVRLRDIFWVREVGGAESAVTFVVPSLGLSLVWDNSKFQGTLLELHQWTSLVAIIDH